MGFRGLTKNKSRVSLLRMTDQSALLAKIDAFLDRHFMEATAFGQALGDGHLVFDLRKGKRKLRRRTIAKIEAYMTKKDDRARKRA
jgi:hypothetical protein